MSQQLILRLPEQLAQKVRESVLANFTAGEDLITQIEHVEGEYFIFKFNQIDYPAMIFNLPTLIETQKTFDRKIFYKSGDIGQMLQVFENHEAREQAKIKYTKTRNGETYHASGITSATHDIVKKRFELTQKSTDSYDIAKVKSVIAEMSASWTIDGKSTQTANSTGHPTDVEIITEEIVDFEEWMVDPSASNSSETDGNFGVGLTYTVTKADWEGDLGLILQHPELLEGPRPGRITIFRNPT